MAAIRRLTRADLPALLRLSRSASRNQPSEDWIRLLSLEPSGCFGIELEGTLAATVTVVCYPPVLAWLGMVLTLPEYRGLACGHVELATTFAFRPVRRLTRISLHAPARAPR